MEGASQPLVQTLSRLAVCIGRRAGRSSTPAAPPSKQSGWRNVVRIDSDLPKACLVHGHRPQRGALEVADVLRMDDRPGLAEEPSG